ncbi:MAG: RDD family protein [Acidobacteriota bacterium]|nr:RDD family protein [Acidobacteriota bacterium]
MPCKNHPLVEAPLFACARCGELFCTDCIVQIGGLSYCAPCKQQALGDLRAGVPVTGLDPASIGRRFGALMLDGLLLSIPAMVLFAFGISRLGLFNARQPASPDVNLILVFEGIVMLYSLVAWILYEGLMLRSGGQTLGKKAMRIRVVTPEGGPLSRGQAFGRAAMRQVFNFVPCLGLIDYLIAFGQERTCLHDMVARTRVINWNA